MKTKNLSKLLALHGPDAGIFYREGAGWEHANRGEDRKGLAFLTYGGSFFGPDETEAAMGQVEAIRRLEEEGQLALLPDKLREAAFLRLAHPEDTLSQLAEQCDPPITKSALNHRLRKLVELAKEERQA